MQELKSEALTLAHAVSTREAPHEVLRDRRADVITARACMPSGSTVIVKLWNRLSIKGALRRLTRTNAGWREWQALHTLSAAGVRVPQPISYVRLTSRQCAHTEALISEDLGDGGRAVELVKSLVARGAYAELRGVCEQLLQLTEDMLESRLVDPDHRLENFIVARDGQLSRIDLEHCVSMNTPWGAARYGRMLGTLIGSYVFAVQPEVHLAESFAQALVNRLAPPQGALRRASMVIDAMLQRQRERVGIDSHVAIGWL